VRIAIDVDGQFGPQPSGIHHYVDSLLLALLELESDEEFTAFAPALRRGQRLPTQPLDSGPAWAMHPRVRLDVPNWSALPAPFEGIALRRRMRSASRRFDVLHIPHTHCRVYEASRPRRLVATIYDLATRLHPRTQRPEWVLEWDRYFAFCRDRCTRVLTISQASKRDIVEHLGIPEERIDVTPLAPRTGTRRIIDGKERVALLAPWGLANAPFVLYAGTLEPRKNLGTLIQAFARAVHELADPAVLLVLAGGVWGDHDEEVLAVAEHNGVADRVIRTGYVPDETLNALMSACRVFAYVSVYEGFGLPPLEAMACGAPVIVSNVSSLPEVVGRAGLQVPPTDGDRVATALHRLLANDDERLHRRRASLARAAEFSWARTAELTLRSYEQAAATSRKGGHRWRDPRNGGPRGLPPVDPSSG
jgi:glycosyltransferase involved in cell wall biosynthesis